MSSKKMSLGFGTIELAADEFIIIRLNYGEEIDLDKAKIMKQKTYELLGDKKYVLLIDANTHIQATKEARDWGSRPEAHKNLIAQAFLIKSISNKLIGNFIIKFHKPAVNTRLFSDEKSALEWLSKQLEQ